MQADVVLKQRQAFWETPRNVAILLAAVAAIFSALAGSVGFRLGQTASLPPQIIFQPGSIVVSAPASHP